MLPLPPQLVFFSFILLAVVLAGVLIFKEDLSLTNKLGILLGTVSVIMIQL